MERGECKAVTSRRTVLCMSAAGGLSALFPLSVRAARDIPQRVSARVIVDNDFAGDPDGLIALAHQLLSPKTRVPLVTVSALNPKFAGPKAGTSAARGRADALEMIGIGGFATPPQVVAGAEAVAAADNPAAAAIVAEAMRDDPLPLFLTCGGPLTNVSAALRLRPEIARRMTLIWIGGGEAGDGEYNLDTDPAAARLVLEESDVPLWQVPAPTYRALQFGVAELTADFRPISPLTRWLYDRYTRLPAWVDLGGALTMGDSPLVLLSAVSASAGRYRDVAEGRSGRRVRRYDTLDGRLMWADALAKFAVHARTLPLRSRARHPR